jgi:hypothetical protein
MAERLRRDSPMDSLTEARRVVLSDLAEHPARGDGQSPTARGATECAPPLTQQPDVPNAAVLLLASSVNLAVEPLLWPPHPR